MTFFHLGYASENPDVAEVYQLPEDIILDFEKILDLGEIPSDALKGESQRAQTRLPSGKLDNSLQKFQEKRNPANLVPTDTPLIKGKQLYDNLKNNLGEKADIYPHWYRRMRAEFGKDFEKEARAIWKETKTAQEIVQEITPNKIRKIDLLTPGDIMSNAYGRYPTTEAIRDAKNILGDDFLKIYSKFRKRISIARGNEDPTFDEALLFEEFARRVVATNKLGRTSKDYTEDIRGEITQRYQLNNPQYIVNDVAFRAYSNLDLTVPDMIVEGYPQLSPTERTASVNLRLEEKNRILRKFLFNFSSQDSYESFLKYKNRTLSKKDFRTDYETKTIQEGFDRLSKEIDEAFKTGKKKNNLSEYTGKDITTAEGTQALSDVSGVNYQLKKPKEFANPFYSQMQNVLGQKLPSTFNKEQLNNIINSGEIKKAEVDWSGIKEWIDSKEGKINKNDLINFLKANELKIEEVQLGGKEIKIFLILKLYPKEWRDSP